MYDIDSIFEFQNDIFLFLYEFNRHIELFLNQFEIKSQQQQMHPRRSPAAKMAASTKLICAIQDFTLHTPSPIASLISKDVSHSRTDLSSKLHL